ncbi:MAG: sulfatase family protein [Planctomycetota bacterium]
MADEGLRLTSFYVTSGVCTPSRSSLMTGCYPRRVNMHKDAAGFKVLFPVAQKGLNPNEITIAEVLKTQNYKTACIGKWHLGDQKQFLPTRQGFDSYFGIPYSNDMHTRQRKKNPPLPLLKNETVIEAPVNQDTLTKRYTEQAVKFITENKDHPFFLYLPHAMPHDPQHASDQFRGKSANGIYGDTVEEIDYSTGQILKTLKKLNIDENTLVIFTSDNGAAHNYGGSNLPLSGFKSSILEGGMREPCVVRWPGKVSAGTSCDELTSTIDLLPTFALLAGTTPPENTIIDGKDIRPILFGKANAKSPHEAFYYYQVDQLQAVRSGKWKLHLPLETKRMRKLGKPEMNSPVKLYDLNADIAEKNNIADKHPDIVKKLLALAEKARADLGDVNREGQNQRPAGFVKNPVPLTIKTR